MLIAVLNGPNLNLLGVREPAVYGTATLAEVESALRHRGDELGVDVAWSQTNDEGTLVESVQGLRGTADGALINAAAYTHTSLALRDAVLATEVPFVEVHLSNVFARDRARHRSVLADLAVGLIVGFGASSYVLGLEALVEHLRNRS